jgi:hypothetical protein
MFTGKGIFIVPSGSVVTGILDMRANKHVLHFLVNGELLLYAIVKIPSEKMYFGVL